MGGVGEGSDGGGGEMGPESSSEAAGFTDSQWCVVQKFDEDPAARGTHRTCVCVFVCAIN